MGDYLVEDNFPLVVISTFQLLLNETRTVLICAELDHLRAQFQQLQLGQPAVAEIVK
jgi:hypothetical protein